MAFYVISTNGKCRPCGCDTETAQRNLSRMINAPFIPPDDRKRILPKLIRAETRVKGGAAVKFATGIPEYPGIDNRFSLHGK